MHCTCTCCALTAAAVAAKQSLFVMELIIICEIEFIAFSTCFRLIIHVQCTPFGAFYCDFLAFSSYFRHISISFRDRTTRERG